MKEKFSCKMYHSYRTSTLLLKTPTYTPPRLHTPTTWRRQWHNITTTRHTFFERCRQKQGTSQTDLTHASLWLWNPHKWANKRKPFAKSAFISMNSKRQNFFPPKVTTHANRHKAHQRSWVSGTTTQKPFLIRPLTPLYLLQTFSCV